MKKLYLSLVALLSFFSLSAQTYTDITPAKFDFNAYKVGALDNFWNYFYQAGHAPAGNVGDVSSVFSVAPAANFTDGYAYFYFNQPCEPNTFTSIAEVEGVGNVLRFGDSGHGAGFGGFYLAPTCEQTEGLMRTTFVFRVLKGENNSNTNATINVGVRDIKAGGKDLDAISYANLMATTEANQWYKVVIEYNPTYALRVNYAQLIWGNLIEIAQVKFETVTDVAEDYEAVSQVITGTAEELGIEPPVVGEIAYTDITPEKFNFNGYAAGALDNFWDYFYQAGHAPAGSVNDEKSMFNVAPAANFTDGYAYFYFNQPCQPNTFTSIAEVEGVGNVLRFGDSGHGAGFGGFYLAPTCEQTEGLMRTTFIFRLTKGVNNSNTGATINVGIRDIEAGGCDLNAISYADMMAATEAGEWYKVVIEYNPTYALRVNFAQLIWGNLLEVAQVKFETMTGVPEDYEQLREITKGTPEELGISSNTSAIKNIFTAVSLVDIKGNTVNFNGNAVVYSSTGAVVAQGTTANLAPGLYIANVNGKGVKFIIR